MGLDNQQVAILTKVNALAERHGIKPYEFSALLDYDTKTDKTILNFASADYHVEKKMETMLNSIASQDRMPSDMFAGTTKEIIDALDGALAKAPRSRIG